MKTVVMRVTKTQVLSLVIAIAVLAILQIPGLFRNQAPTEVSMPAKREPAPVTQIQTEPRFDGGPAMTQASNQTIPFAQIELESPGTTPAATQPVDRTQVPNPNLVRIAELENQPVDTALTELLPMLDAEDPAIRRAVVESLGDMSTEAAVPALTTALSDTDPQVRIVALEGLATHDARLAVGSIEPYLHDQDAEVRLAAIEALSDLDSKSAVHALASLLYDQDSTIRLLAVSALGDIGGKNAVMYLGQARYDPEASVRANAFHILSELEYDAPHSQVELTLNPNQHANGDRADSFRTKIME